MSQNLQWSKRILKQRKLVENATMLLKQVAVDTPALLNHFVIMKRVYFENEFSKIRENMLDITGMSHPLFLNSIIYWSTRLNKNSFLEKHRQGHIGLGSINYQKYRFRYKCTRTYQFSVYYRKQGRTWSIVGNGLNYLASVIIHYDNLIMSHHFNWRWGQKNTVITSVL